MARDLNTLIQTVEEAKGPDRELLVKAEAIEQLGRIHHRNAINILKARGVDAYLEGFGCGSRLITGDERLLVALDGTVQSQPITLSHGPCGPRVRASSPGEAFEMAIAAAEGADAVVFFERGQG
jgi:hypothetical protein